MFSREVRLREGMKRIIQVKAAADVGYAGHVWLPAAAAGSVAAAPAPASTAGGGVMGVMAVMGVMGC
jgi:hypothetical protein